MTLLGGERGISHWASYSHGTRDIGSGIKEEVGDAVLILVAAVPERHLEGERQETLK